MSQQAVNNSKKSTKTDEYEEISDDESVSCKERCKKSLVENILLLLLICSIGIGIGIGVGLRMVVKPNEYQTLSYVKFPGEMLMRMLKMLILPLIVSSLISGLAGLDAKASGKMGGRAVAYYMTTTFIAVVLGIALVLTIQPGSRGQVNEPNAQVKKEDSSVADAFLDLLRNMFPDNLVVATFRSTRTLNKEVLNSNGSVMMNGNTTVTKPTPTMPEGTNVLGLVVYSVILGLIVARMGPSGLPLTHFFDALAEVTMRMVGIIIWFSPIGIMSLIAAEIIAMADPVQSLQQLALYMATILTGLAVHGFIILPIIFLIFTRRNPIRYVSGILPAMATAFGTASSSATLPVTYRCLEETNRIDHRVTRFVLPVGATINMDGTALYEAVAPIFIAQLNGIPLSFGQIVTISITATCASIGAASVPQAGLVTMVIVLTAAGLPTDDIAKILAVDWFLDRFRTMVNVLGDSIGAGIVYYRSKKELALMDEESSNHGRANRGYDSDSISETEAHTNL